VVEKVCLKGCFLSRVGSGVATRRTVSTRHQRTGSDESGHIAAGGVVTLDPDMSLRPHSEPTEIRRLVRRSLPEADTWLDVSDVVGMPQVQVKLDDAMKSGHPPRFLLLDAICRATGLSLYDLVAAAAVDAGYGHLAEPVEPDLVELSTMLRGASADVRAAIRWLASIDLRQRASGE
jgi:hypothetical protein